MNRRELITRLGGATAASWPLAAFAQDARKPYRIGFVSDIPTVYADAIEAFRRRRFDLPKNLEHLAHFAVIVAPKPHRQIAAVRQGKAAEIPG